MALVLCLGSGAELLHAPVRDVEELGLGIVVLVLPAWVCWWLLAAGEGSGDDEDLGGEGFPQ